MDWHNHPLTFDDAPADIQTRNEIHLLDLIGTAVTGRPTDMAAIALDTAATDMAGSLPLPFDDRTASAQGVAMATAMMIDAMDGHDGFNPSKGHIGCPLIGALLPFAPTDGRAFLDALITGYEIGARLAIAQHSTAPEFHASGSWGAVTGAAVLAMMNDAPIGPAMGIAEYHSPRAPMMREIDIPSMCKDGSGWGAPVAVMAYNLARRGFSSAPVRGAPAELWQDWGDRWYIREQYFKPYPVCRWAQPSVEAVLALRRAHNIAPEDIASVDIHSFHEAKRLATTAPTSTEEAQYSTAFPTAIALARGDVTGFDLCAGALDDPLVRSLAGKIAMFEDSHANDAFPLKRFARVIITMQSGEAFTSDWHEPRWDHDAPATNDEIIAKFKRTTEPYLSPHRIDAIIDVITTLDKRPFDDLARSIYAPLDRGV